MPAVEVAPLHELSFDESLRIWLDIERAKDGQSSYGGGDVAEIWANRLLPTRLREHPPEDLAAIAGRNLTRILRTFTDICPGISFEIADTGPAFRALDLATESCPPFTHCVQLRVSQGQRIRAELADGLCALWDRLCAEDPRHLPQPYFNRWATATLELLQALGKERAR